MAAVTILEASGKGDEEASRGKSHDNGIAGRPDGFNHRKIKDLQRFGGSDGCVDMRRLAAGIRLVSAGI